MGMITIDPKNARMLSMLGQRGSIFGIALPDIAAQREDIRVLTADLGILSGLTKFQAAYPDRYLNLGIAEQNMVGVATGLARGGNCVFVTTYATFLTMRSFEQIRDNLGYMRANVKLVGSTAGVAMGFSGNTHYAIEDLALMRAIPNMTVLSPADGAEALKMAYAVCDMDGPVYIRLTGLLNCPMVYKEEFEYKIGKANVLREGADVGIIAVGTMVHEALKAAELLEAEGISCGVVDMHTIKPLDSAALDAMFARYGHIATVEEHSIVGGLGGAVAEYKAAKAGAPPQLILGLPDAFGKAAEQGYLLEKYGLTAAGIAENIRKFVAK